MGNWAKALQNAGEGVKGLAGMKMQEADWMYKEIAQQNQYRHQEQMQKNQQEFVSSEATKQFDREMPYRVGALNLQAQGIEAQQKSYDLQLERMEQQWDQFMMQYGQTERRIGVEESRAEQTGQREAARTAQEQQKIDQKALEAARESLPGAFFSGTQEEKDALQAKYDAIEEMLKIKPVDGDISRMQDQRGAFQQVYDYMAGSTPTKAQAASARKAAMAYAKANEQDRQLIIEGRDKYLQQGMPTGAAMANSVNDFLNKSKPKEPKQEKAAETPAPAAAPANANAEMPQAPEMAANAPPAARQGYPLPPAPSAQPSDLEKEMEVVAQEMGIKVDKSVPGWMGGNIPPKDRDRVRKEAERRIAEREGVNGGSDFIAAAAQ